MSIDDTPSVVSNYAHMIANGGLRRQPITTISASDRAHANAILAYLEKHGVGFKCIRAEESIGAALAQFAATEHKFTDPTGRDWVAKTAEGANCPNTPEGWLQSLHHICRGYPLTVVLVVDKQVADQRFLDLYAAAPSDSRIVIIE